MAEQILIVEDERALRETLAYNLARQGYAVETAADGKAAIEKARALHPDLIILDLMLPVLDGFEVTRILRQEMSVPIIMLTARAEEIDRIIGLEIGADDYLTKPFSLRELEARVKAQIRRVRLVRDEMKVEEQTGKSIMVYGNLTIDLRRGEAVVDRQPLALKPKEFELLVFLGRHPGQVLSRDLIMERVWGWGFSGGSRTVDVHIRWLREKIETDPANPVRIVTVRGAGYRFEG